MATGTGIIVFSGVLAVAFMTAFVVPRAVQARKDNHRAWSYFWYLVGLVPIALVCVMWARTGDQPWWALAPVLAGVGGVAGAMLLLAIGAAVYPTASAQTPSTSEPPHDNTYYGSSPPPGGLQGHDNTVVGPTDSNGNTIVPGGTVAGSHACGGPGSTVIGSHAGAGSCSPPSSERQ